MRKLLTLAALAVCFLTTPATAAPGDEKFRVSGIMVDATAASATEAQNTALAQGRPKAWQTLYRRLARVQDYGRQPQLDDKALQKLIRGFEVQNERRSTTRYVGSVTYIFNADAVRHLLRTSNIGYAEAVAKRTLVIPLSPGYSPGSGWTRTWADPRFGRGPVPLTLPVGDSSDAGQLGGLNFDSATWAQVSGAAQRAGAQEVVLVLLIPSSGRLSMWVRRLAPSGPALKNNTDINLPPGKPASASYGVAADAAARAIEDVWKARSTIDFNSRGRLTVSYRISSLEDWAGMLAAVGIVQNVQGVTVLAMNTGEAQLALTYVGTADQLRESLTEANLAMTSRAGGWWLTYTPPAPAGDALSPSGTN